MFRVSVILLFFLLNGMIAMAGPVKDYESGNFEKALEGFLKDQNKNPNNPKLKFNIASTHYKSGNYDGAFKSFSDIALSGNPELSQQSFYNLGNVAYQQGKLEEAIGFYQKALELNPQDKDAKYNLEFVRNEIKRRENEQKDQQNNRSDSDNDPQQDQNKNGESEKDQQAKNEPKENESNQPGSQEPQEKPQEQKSAQAPREMAPEEALRLLQGLEEDPLKHKKKKMRALGRRAPAGKDW